MRAEWSPAVAELLRDGTGGKDETSRTGGHGASCSSRDVRERGFRLGDVLGGDLSVAFVVFCGCIVSYVGLSCMSWFLGSLDVDVKKVPYFCKVKSLL